MEDRLIGWLTRAGGALLLAGVGAAWASLLTWSQTDPSLTHAADGVPTNALGTVGAVFADVMLNTLGIVAVFLLLAPMFWGIELMLAGRTFASRKKTSIFPLSVLLLAGGFAVLPIPESWPFAHSFGGIVGDWLYKVTVTILGLVGAEGATALAGLAYFIAGSAALGYSVGLEREHLNAMIERGRGLARRRESLWTDLLGSGWLSGFPTRSCRGARARHRAARIRARLPVPSRWRPRAAACAASQFFRCRRPWRRVPPYRRPACARSRRSCVDRAEHGGRHARRSRLRIRRMH